MLKERLPKEVRLNGTCSSGTDDDRNDRVLLRVYATLGGGIDRDQLLITAR